ncbi:hypothetical protein [Streptomyces xylophagus]|uniref:hypothetical protein n=1 Tax=Streptomyces xylophagus TaxID=285514 RepID=UPI0004C3DDC9|nr:hypothetical protein [Streptomyces xylophagus]
MTRLLRTTEEIRAAGAAAVADWPPLTDQQVDQMVALLTPVRSEVWVLLSREHPDDRAQRPANERTAA